MYFLSNSNFHNDIHPYTHAVGYLCCPLPVTVDVCVVPGEVEEDLLAYSSAVCHCTQLELSSTDVDYRAHKPPTNTESQVYKN